MNKPKTSPYIKINHLRIAGNYHRDVPFTDGLNIIEGENGLGKTTLLRLIQYGLGLQQPVHGSNWEKTLIPELKESVAVLVECDLNGQTYTIRRDINKNQDIGVVSSGEIDTALRTDVVYNIKNRQVSDFLLSRLGVPSIEIQSESELGSKAMYLATDHLLKMMYLDQDIGYTALGNSLGEKLRMASTELLLGIINSNYYDLEISEQLEKDRRKHLHDELKHALNFLVNLDVLTSSEIELRRKKLSSELHKLKEKIAQLKLNMRSNPDYRSELREAFLQADAELNSLKSRQIEIQQSLARYALAETSVTQERERVQRAAHAKTVLSRYSIEVCPGCNQTLNKEMRARRLQNECELCGRAMPTIEDATDEIEWRQKVLQDESKEIDSLRIKRQNELIEIGVLISSTELKRSHAAEKLNTLKEQYVNELINQIEDLRLQITGIEQELSLLDFQAKAQASIERLNLDIQNIDDSLAQIAEQKKIYQRQLQEAQEVLQDFESALKAFLKAIDFFNFDTVFIHPETYLPYVAGRAYRQLSTSQRDLVILGYYYAFLRLSLSRKTNYPRLLIIDTMRKDDIDQETMIKGLQQFDKLYALFGVPYQVIIAMREAPKEFNQYIRLSLRGSDYLLRSKY